MAKTLKKTTVKAVAKKIIQEKHSVSKIIQKILKPHSAKDKKLILNILKKGKIDKTLKKNKQGKKKKTKKKSNDVNVSAVKINIELTKHLIRINNLTKTFNGSQSALSKELKKDKHKDKDFLNRYIKVINLNRKPNKTIKKRAGFGHIDMDDLFHGHHHHDDQDYDDQDYDDQDYDDQDYDDQDYDGQEYDDHHHDQDYDDHIDEDQGEMGVNGLNDSHDNHSDIASVDHNDHHGDHDSNLPDCGSYIFNPETGLGNANCIPKDDAPHSGHFEDCCDIGSHVIGNAETNVGETEGQNIDHDGDSKICEQTAVGMTGSGDIFCKQRYYQLNHDGQAGALGDLENLQTDGGNNIYFNPAQPISDGEREYGLQATPAYRHDSHGNLERYYPMEDNHYDDLDNDSLVYERCCFEDNAEGGSIFTDTDAFSTDSSLTWTDSEGDIDPREYLSDGSDSQQESLGNTLSENVEQYNSAVLREDEHIPDEIYNARVDDDYLERAGLSGSGNDSATGWLLGGDDNTGELKRDIQHNARWFSDENEQGWTTVDRGDLVQGSGSNLGTGSNVIFGRNTNQSAWYDVIDTNP